MRADTRRACAAAPLDSNGSYGYRLVYTRCPPNGPKKKTSCGIPKRSLCWLRRVCYHSAVRTRHLFFSFFSGPGEATRRGRWPQRSGGTSKVKTKKARMAYYRRTRITRVRRDPHLTTRTIKSATAIFRRNETPAPASPSPMFPAAAPN